MSAAISGLVPPLSFTTTVADSRRAILAVMLAVVLCAGSVRLLTFDRYYPINDYVDEPIYLALAHEARGLSDQSAIRIEYGTLAPFYIGLSQIVQIVYDRFKASPWDIPGEYLYVMRAVSAVFGVLTALIVAWLGWQMAGKFAALVAGLIWALSPVVIDFNSLAIPDPPLYMVCALAVASALFAWKRQSFVMLAISFMCGVVAIYTKLWIVTALLPFMLVTLLLVRADRRWLKRVTLLYVIGIGFAIHFLLILNPLVTTHKVRNNISSGDFFANVVNTQRLANNFWHMLLPADQGKGIALAILVVGVAAYIYCRRHKTTSLKLDDLLFVTVCTVAMWWMSAGISNINYDGAGRMRHIFPAVVSFLPLWAALLMQIGLALRHWFARWRYTAAWLPGGVVAATLLVILPGFITGDLQRIADFRRDHVNTRTVAWFDISPPRDGVVLSPSKSITQTLWNPFWGMYVDSKPYDQWFEPIDTVINTSPATYLQRNIQWLVLDDADVERATDPAAARDYLAQLLHVKTITANPAEVYGRTVNIYRFALPNHAADFTFGGDITLMSFDLSKSTVKAGETLSFRPYWTLVNPTSKNLSLFFHLYTAQSVEAEEPKLLGQVDTTPMHNTDAPTSSWQDTTEVYFGDAFLFTIPEGLPSGDYVLALGLYDYLSGERLAGQEGNTYYRIDIRVS